MYQDPSIGDIKVYYVVTKIIVLNSTVEQVRSYHCVDVIRLIIGHFRVYLVPLFRNEVPCKIFDIKMSLTCMKAKHIFI